ncbi:MAG: zinc-dependent metalloprotease [Gammaproteobacteria bacterium]
MRVAADFKHARSGLAMCVSVVALALSPMAAQADAAPTPVTASPDGALLPVSVDAGKNRVLLTLPAADGEGVSGRYLFTQSIKTGLGSADVTIDRGMQGDTRVLAFRRMGGKVAVVFENPRYRASGDASVQKGATASFPFSTIALLDVVNEGKGGLVTVDATPLLLTDAMDLGGSLASSAKGFRLSEKLSAVDPTSVKVFPRNIEMETLQTFVGDVPGNELNTIAPDGRAISFTVHSSFIALPEPGYVPRKWDTRSGSKYAQIYDFGTPLGAPMLTEYATRFRLEKIDAAAARSPVKKPIVFYIDPAAPEPIRSAVATGVRWWADAFDAAGFVDAFKVESLPPGVDPLDARYNVVNWASRQNRGWSYGNGVIDPRTGEIIKASIVLDALRARQNITIFEGLVGTAHNDTGDSNDPVRVALVRLSQLAAHEVGHGLGFVHNWRASVQDRASVMDYPGPKVAIIGGQLDLGDAYATGIGPWDKFTVDWLYGQPTPGVDGDAEAKAKADAIYKAGFLFGTDTDGLAPDTPLPGVNMFTDGQDMPADLEHTRQVRRIALDHFGPQVLHAGEPLADLRRKFVPIWLFHRYSVPATGKLVGGVIYDYALAGQGRPLPTRVPAVQQLAAMDALVATLSERELTVPEPLAMLLSSGTSDRGDVQTTREVFKTAGTVVFDPLVAADVAAQITLDSLLAPSRLTRLHIQHGYDAGQPDVATLLDKLHPVISAHASPIARRISQRTLLAIAAAAEDPDTPTEIAAELRGSLAGVGQTFARASGTGSDALWQRSMAQLFSDPAALAAELDKTKRRPPVVPEGIPIGGEIGWFDNVADSPPGGLAK